MSLPPFSDPTHTLVETVPNFSEGQELALVQGIIDAMAAVPGALVLDQASDPDHHRSVITAVAVDLPAIAECAFAGIRTAVATLDIRRHTGVHPRVGVADVVPLVPMRGVTLAATAQCARDLAQRVAEELGVPVYCYEAAAYHSERQALSAIRNRGWEFIATVIGSDPAWAPDYGPHALHPTAGACVIGARDFLIAFNINLACEDLNIARSIASRIRATAPGGLPSVRALGFRVAHQGCVQVSINLLNYRDTNLEKVYEWVERLATMAGVKIRDSELVGLIPEAATAGFDMARLKIRDWSSDRILEHRIAERS
ncbi:MAG: glutamate formimidoyltransferase [bacterium]